MLTQKTGFHYHGLKKYHLLKSNSKTVLQAQAVSLSGTKNSSQLAVMLEQAHKT